MIKIKSISEVKSHLSGLRAVIFDLDDTLYSEKEYVRSGFAAVAALLCEVEDAQGKLWSFFERGESAIDALLLSEGIYSDEQKALCLAEYRSHAPLIHLYEGARDLLLELRREGYLVGLITDGRPDGQRAKIHALALDGVIDEIIVTDELGGAEYRKPCASAFELMRERLSARSGSEISYAEMCYVGDNTAKDFIAPDSLGMRSILFDNPDGIYNKNFG